MKKVLLYAWEVSKIIIIAMAIVIPVRYFLFQPFFVKGQSMEPNFGNGDYLIVDEISYKFREPARGEVIVFNYPENPSQRFIKRIIGLPGETVEIKDNKITIIKDENILILDESKYIVSETSGDIKVVLKQDEYFVLGDNRPFSFDSRRFGIVPEKEIIGRAVLRAWPFSEFDIFQTPDY
ncbi:MAG: signal peptidase I [Candidatus Nealsonbacteria bacterium]